MKCLNGAVLALAIAALCRDLAFRLSGILRFSFPKVGALRALVIDRVLISLPLCVYAIAAALPFQVGGGIPVHPIPLPVSAGQLSVVVDGRPCPCAFAVQQSLRGSG